MARKTADGFSLWELRLGLDLDPAERSGIQSNSDIIGRIGNEAYLNLLGLSTNKIRQPVLGSTPPPRGATARNRDPFDFFGTLFAGSKTNQSPMQMLNQSI